MKKLLGTKIEVADFDGIMLVTAFVPVGWSYEAIPSPNDRRVPGLKVLPIYEEDAGS